MALGMEHDQGTGQGLLLEGRARPQPERALPDTDLRPLRMLVVRRRQVVAMCAQEKARLDSAPTAMRPHIQAHLD